MCMVPDQVDNRGDAEYGAGADRVVFCEAGLQEQLFIFDGLPACRRSGTMERQKTKCSIVHSFITGRS